MTTRDDTRSVWSRILYTNSYKFYRRGWVWLGYSLALIGILASIVLLIAIPAYLLEREACFSKADGMERDRYYDFFGGCMIQTDDGTYVPMDNYRLTEEELQR